MAIFPCISLPTSINSLTFYLNKYTARARWIFGVSYTPGASVTVSRTSLMTASMFAHLIRKTGLFIWEGHKHIWSSSLSSMPPLEIQGPCKMNMCLYEGSVVEDTSSLNLNININRYVCLFICVCNVKCYFVKRLCPQS